MKIEIRDSTEFQKLMLKNGYSQRSLSMKLNKSSAYINQIITGKRNPSGKMAKNIADVLGVDFDAIFLIKDACKS